jgi:DNA-binding transcriptional LysR family regulator
MELRHLRYFAAVAEALSFRAAAEALNLSGPALSKQVKDLETELGVRLLDRNTTQVRLTNAGAVFLAEARQLLAQAGQAVARAREAEAGRRGRLTIANAGAILANYLAASLSNFCARYPGVDVSLVDLDLFDQLEALAAGKIQVGFMLGGNTGQLPGGLQQSPVLHSPLGVAMSARNALARLRRVPLADAARERILAIGGRRVSFHTDLIRAIFTARGLAPREIVLVNGFESLMAMIAAGQGVSILAQRGSVGRSGDIVIRPLRETGPDLGIELCAVWHRSAAPSIAENFVDELRRLTAVGGKGPGPR